MCCVVAQDGCRAVGQGGPSTCIRPFSAPKSEMIILISQMKKLRLREA